VEVELPSALSENHTTRPQDLFLWMSYRNCCLNHLLFYTKKIDRLQKFDDSLKLAGRELNLFFHNLIYSNYMI
jgi:hypothetical protein